MINWRKVAEDYGMNYHEFMEEVLICASAHMDNLCSEINEDIVDFDASIGILKYEKTINSSG